MSSQIGISLLFMAFALGMAFTPAQAQDPEGPRRSVSVSGEGTVEVAPDRAVVRFGVVTRAQDPEVARQQNAEASRDALNAVRDLGVPERRIRLETLRLQPVYEYNDQRRRREEVGFEAIRQVVVEVDSLDALPALVTRVVQQGANRLQGVSYELQNRREARDEALREAVTEARAKAELMASTLGARLGPVLTINEQSFDFPQPYREMDVMAMRATAKEAAPEPDAYASGEIEVKATVQVVFALEGGTGTP